jgi:rhomboid protease GluP
LCRRAKEGAVVDLVRVSLLFLAGLILLTSLWVLFDARRNRVPTRGRVYTFNTGAGAWFVGCLLLWIVVFPTYLMRRRLWSRQQAQRDAFARAEDLTRGEAEPAAERPASAGEEAEKLVRSEPEPSVEQPASAPEEADPSVLVAVIEAQRLGRFDAVHLAPNIPTKLYRDVLNGGFDLAPGELILAVIDPSLKMRPRRSWVLTTRRVVSCDPRREHLPAGSASELTKVDERAFEPGLALALRHFLDAVGPGAGGAGLHSVPAALANFGFQLVPSLAAQTRQFRAEQAYLREFRAALRAETPRVFVTPAFVVICVALFACMVRPGVSGLSPSVSDLLDWGAEYGLSVALDHEYWRLVAAIFVHVGILHLVLNMVCLLWAGPTVERLFGNLAFAAVYVLSGLGGAIASMAVHPLLVSAGASGSIFGLFGALVGFLLVRRHSVPGSILKPLGVSAIAFIILNLVAGMAEPRIDMAAHLGGVVTGFACGLLLSRRLPVVDGHRGILRRLAIGTALAVALLVAARTATYAVTRNPEVRALIRNRQAETYNQLVLQMIPEIHRYARLRKYLEGVLTKLPYRREFFGDDAMVESAPDIVQKMHRMTVDDDELRSMLKAVVTAVDAIGEAAGMVKRALDAEDARLPNVHTSRWSQADWDWLKALWDEAEQPLKGKLEVSKRAMEQAISLRDRYLREQGLDASFAQLEELRHRFRDEAAVIRERHHMDTPDLPPQIYAMGRERLAELEAMLVEQEWSWRLPSPYSGESSAGAP